MDPIRLRQVLDNLLSNAIKFTPEGGWIRVEAIVESEGGLALSVADSGIGIAEHDHQRVFDEFQQAGDTAARHSGTGLGLALTRRLVQAHDGWIELESAPGRGSRFTVHLPGPVRPEPGQPAAPAASRQDAVLIIEDDPNAAELLRTYLESAGYRTVVTHSGEAGLAAVGTHRPAASTTGRP